MAEVRNRNNKVNAARARAEEGIKKRNRTKGIF